MASRPEIELAVLHRLHGRGCATLDVLVQARPRFTGNEVFLAVDRLSREGKVILRHPTQFEYVVSAPSAGDRASVPVTGKGGTAA
ncbi:hypothetical protein [Nitrospira sp. Kam-Ns4a]